MSKTIDRVAHEIEPIINERGDELVDIEYVKERQKYYLRIYVDHEGGIDIAEIARLSELVSEKIDNLDPDPFPDPYVLELSSPGLERPLKNERDWQRAKGQYVHLTLYQKIDNAKIYEGDLIDFDDEQVKLNIQIKTRKKTIAIPRKAIAKIRFAVKF